MPRQARPNIKTPPYLRWAERRVPWIFDRGNWHVATCLAPVGTGTLATLACGGASARETLFIGSFFDIGLGPRLGLPSRFCRRCRAQLQLAGEKGPIRRPEA